MKARIAHCKQDAAQHERDTHRLPLAFAAFALIAIMALGVIGSLASPTAAWADTKLPATDGTTANTTANATANTTVNTAVSATANTTVNAAVSATANSTATITLSAVGDCTLGVDSRYNSNFNRYYKKHGSAYFFKKVRSVLAADDVTVANFEGVLTSGGKRANKTFTFRGPAKYASILTKGSVEVVTLANNHSMDFGKAAFNSTKKTLAKNRIAVCHNSTIAYKTVKGVKMAFLGYSALSSTSVTKAKKQVRTGIAEAKAAGAKIVVVSFHWGIEGTHSANSKQKKIGRYAIDCGASLVLGHHPHVLQGIEKYKNRYIVYSLGNFCFGGNSNPRDKNTMIFQQTFTVKDGELASKNSARIIPCSLSGSSSTNTFQPRVLKGSAKKSMIKKMNSYSKGLGTSVASNGKLR